MSALFPEASPAARCFAGAVALLLCLAGRSGASITIALAASAGLWMAGASPRALVRSVAAPLGVVSVAAVLVAAPWRSPASLEALRQGLAIPARVLGACLVGRWLVTAVSPPELGLVAVRAGVPRELVELVALATRYGLLLRGDAQRLVAGAHARLAFGSYRGAMSTGSTLGGALLLRAAIRADALGASLALRGYPGRDALGTTVRAPGAHRNGRVLAAATLLCAGAVLIDRHLQTRGWP